MHKLGGHNRPGFVASETKQKLCLPCHAGEFFSILSVDVPWVPPITNCATQLGFDPIRGLSSGNQTQTPRPVGQIEPLQPAPESLTDLVVVRRPVAVRGIAEKSLEPHHARRRSRQTRLATSRTGRVPHALRALSPHLPVVECVAHLPGMIFQPL